MLRCAQSKINETKDLMKKKAMEIEKSKIEAAKGGKGGRCSAAGLRLGRGCQKQAAGRAGFCSGEGACCAAERLRACARGKAGQTAMLPPPLPPRLPRAQR